mgnify:CR=1 FL=1
MKTTLLLWLELEDPIDPVDLEVVAECARRGLDGLPWINVTDTDFQHKPQAWIKTLPV